MIPVGSLHKILPCPAHNMPRARVKHGDIYFQFVIQQLVLFSGCGCCQSPMAMPKSCAEAPASSGSPVTPGGKLLEAAILHAANSLIAAEEKLTLYDKKKFEMINAPNLSGRLSWVVCAY